MAWLKGLSAVDLGISFVNGKHFAATQEMTEETRQEVAFQGAFGTDGPVLRRIRPADEGTISFNAVLLAEGAGDRMKQCEISTCRSFVVLGSSLTEAATGTEFQFGQRSIKSCSTVTLRSQASRHRKRK